jgi:hypothetical protein
MNNQNEQITTTQSKASVSTSKRSTSATKADWLVPAGLIVLSAVPFIAGIVRVAGLGGGAEVTPDNARFFADPTPVVLHIIGASLFCILGAFQFAPGFRRRRPGWHRVAGRLLVACGLVAGLSGLWMTQFYPLYPHLQAELLYGLRIVFGSAMVLSIALGFVAALRRDFAGHRAWMIRGYAIGQGAGTQVLTAVFWLLFFGTPDEFTREMLLGAGWVINIVVAEWIIRRNSSRGRQRSTGDGRVERGMARG